MFTFGIILCLICLAIYGLVVFQQICRIDRLEQKLKILADRQNLQRQQSAEHIAWLQNLTHVKNGLLKRFRAIETASFQVQMTPVSGLNVSGVEFDEIHSWDEQRVPANAFVTTSDVSP
jgi:hypothetical protein